MAMMTRLLNEYILLLKMRIQLTLLGIIMLVILDLKLTLFITLCCLNYIRSAISQIVNAMSMPYS